MVLVGTSKARWPLVGDGAGAGGGGSDARGGAEDDGVASAPGGSQSVVERAHGDEAAVPGDAEVTSEEAARYEQLIASQVDGEVAIVELCVLPSWIPGGGWT